MRFAITGSTGLVGTELIRHLKQNNHEVTRIVRSFSGVEHGERAVVWHPDQGRIDAKGLEGHDVVVHLAGENIAGVWTEGKKRRILDSRVQGTTLLAATIARLARPPRVLLSASGFDIYGDRPDAEILDEASSAGTGFLPDVVTAWEKSTAAAAEAGIRVVNTRFGNVLSRDGGMLGVLLPLYRLGLGARIGSGRQFWPWIAIGEIPPAMLHVIDREELRGPVNFVAPQTVTNAEFTDAVAAVVGRPSFLKLPAFAARLAPGGMSEELLLRSARVVPACLLESGYEFRYPELRAALRSIVRR